MPAVAAMPRDDLHGYETINGARLYYAVFNARGGRPVILLHGGFGSSDQWGDEVPRLTRDHEVIVLDTRGHGRSTLGTAPLHYDLLASDVAAIMGRLDVPRAAIVGVSDGAIVGLLLAIHHPARVGALLAWGANFNNDYHSPGPPDRSMFLRYISSVKATYRRVSSTPNGFAKLASALEAMYAREPNIPAADLHRIVAPTIVADGQYEQFVPISHTRLLASLIPGARVVIVPNVSHGGPTQDPVAFHRIVARLLGDPSR